MHDDKSPEIAQLRELYAREMPRISNVGTLCNAGQSQMQGPFLACPPSTYFTARPKFLIVGQETHGWACTDDIEVQMRACREFMLDGSYRRPGPFWNVIKKIEAACGFTERSIAWTNLNRYDRAGRPPNCDDLRILPELDHLLASEVAILSPDIVLFVTGPRFAGRIRAVFPGDWRAAPGFTERQASVLRLPGRVMIQTYHPRHLRKDRLEATFLAYLRSECSSAGDSRPS